VTHGNLFSIVKNTSATVVVRGTFGLARIVILLLIAGKFGPSEFGRLALALSIVDILKVVADLGIDTIAIRYFAANAARTEEFFNSVISLKVLLATVCFVAAPAVFALVYGSAPGIELLLIVALSIYTGLLVNGFVSYFQARLAMTKVLVSNLVGVGIYVVLTAVGISLNWPLAAIVAAIPVGELATLLFMIRLFRREHQIRLAFDKTIILGALKESIYVGISGIIVVTYLRLDTLVIGGLLGDRGVGEYAVAVRLVEPFLLIFSSLSISLYASLSGAWSVAPPSETRRTIKRVLVPVVLLALGAAFFLSFLGKPFISLLSLEYLKSAEVLQVLSWSLVLKAINMQLTAILNSLGKFRIITVIAVNNLLLSMVFNLILISRYGILGAAATVVLVEGLNMLLQFVCFSYVTNNFLGKWLRRWKRDSNRR